MTPQREEAARLLRLARRDHAALQALLVAPGVGVAVAFFHAQQAAEKVLKAAMCLHGLEYRRTHDLEELAGQLADAGHPPSVAEADLRLLTPYAVEYRYDDEAPELLTPEQALSIVTELLAWADIQTTAHP
ncbi:MAG: HEPN domain-containing protein [Accumulibacter sp.]|jgi:HEPN domain-containing protein|uniref:HEPN domain-containing protein n=1 Tax=Accumulibacter sp. TaxID=2053492 RepID=UPI002FC2AB71